MGGSGAVGGSRVVGGHGAGGGSRVVGGYGAVGGLYLVTEPGQSERGISTKGQTSME